MITKQQADEARALLEQYEKQQKEQDLTPSDYLEPRWENSRRVHEWKNYISEEVQGLWLTLTPYLRAALARQAEVAAGREEWD